MEKINIQLPQYWKKKKLNPEFIKDEFGEYRFGTFLHGCAIVKVEMTDNLLSVAIHSQHPIGLPMIKEIRYKYAPNNCLMTMLMPSREQQISDNTVVLYQIPGSFSDTTDVEFEEGKE